MFVRYSCGYSSSVKTWIQNLRYDEGGEPEVGADTCNSWSHVTRDNSVKSVLKHVQHRSRSVMNICDSLQRYR